MGNTHSKHSTAPTMQDYTLDLAILAAFAALCALDIGIGHSAVAGLIVASIGLVVIAVLILVVRFWFEADESAKRVGDQP